MTGLSGALEPILALFALILLGAALRRLPWLDGGFWLAAERLTYLTFFPCLLFLNVSRARFDDPSALGVAVALPVVVLIVAGSAYGAARALRLDGPQSGSLLQGAIRPNTYLGVALGALWGSDGLVTIAICLAASVPLINVIAVSALTAWSGRTGGIGAALRAIATNPLIVAILLGLAANLGGVGLPPVVLPAVEILAQASLPIALLAIGAGLQLSALRAAAAPVSAALALRLLLAPALMYALCTALGVTGAMLAVATLYYALPTAPTAYILSRQLGGDSRLMATIVTVSTLTSMVTLLALAALLGGPVAGVPDVPT